LTFGLNAIISIWYFFFSGISQEGFKN